MPEFLNQLDLKVQQELSKVIVGQKQAIEDILKDAREYYRKKGLISEDEWKIYQEDLNSPNYPYA